jgi:crotonobetainyl-CoA:carnitine CoA-transferase CaiB-like acyl-CoA transferase
VSVSTGGPLAGITVLDLTANMTGPYATMILGEQGAQIIKVEPPGGEVIRRIGTGRGGMSAYFENLNHGKRSAVVDLRNARGVEVVRRLAKSADVFIQNYRPGVIEKMGLGPADLRQSHAELIYVSINGYGLVGPFADAPAYDHVVQAMSGMCAVQADLRDGTPSLVRHGVVDKTTGLFAAQAITAALVGRSVSGKGSFIEVSMLDSALHFVWPDGMMNHTCLDPVDLQPPISRGFRLTKTADGYVALVTVTTPQWEGMLEAVGMDEALKDPNLKGNEGRMRHGGRVMREVAARLALLDTAEVIKRLRQRDVPCMPVSSLEDVARNEQVQASGSLVERDHPILGRITGPRPPIRVEGGQQERLSPAQLPGADTEQVLRENGFSDIEIESLRESGAITGVMEEVET